MLYPENPSCNSRVRNFQLLFRSTCCCWKCVIGHQGSAYVKPRWTLKDVIYRRNLPFFSFSVRVAMRSKEQTELRFGQNVGFFLGILNNPVLFFQVLSTLYRHQVHLGEHDFPEVCPDSPQDGINSCLSSMKSGYLYKKGAHSEPLVKMA